MKNDTGYDHMAILVKGNNQESRIICHQKYQCGFFDLSDEISRIVWHNTVIMNQMQGNKVYAVLFRKINKTNIIETALVSLSENKVHTHTKKEYKKIVPDHMMELYPKYLKDKNHYDNNLNRIFKNKSA